MPDSQSHPARGNQGHSAWVSLANILSLLLLAKLSGFGRAKMVVALLCLRVLGLPQLGHIALISLLVQVLWNPFTGWSVTHRPYLEDLFRLKFGSNLLADWSVRYLGLLIKLGLGFLCYRLTAAWKGGRRVLALHLCLLAITLLLGAVGQGHQLAESILTFALVWFGWNFFCLCLISLESKRLSLREFFCYYMVPFWEVSPIPRPVLELRPQPEKLAELERRSLSIIWTTLALVAGGEVLSWMAFGEGKLAELLPTRPFTPLPLLPATGLSSELFYFYTRWQILLSILLTGILRLTTHFSLFVIIDCCYLFLGYDVPRRFSVPWRAKSFSDFYNLVMPYYVLLVNRLYLYPVFSYLRSRGWNRGWAYESALLVAVFATGFTAHIVRDIHLVALGGPLAYIKDSLLLDTPYFTALYLALRFGNFSERIPQWLRMILLLTLYSAVLGVRLGGLYTPFWVRWQFYGCLFFGFAP